MELEESSSTDRCPVDHFIRQESQHLIGSKIGGDEVTSVLTDMRAQQLESSLVHLSGRSPEGVVAVVAKTVHT